MATCCKILIPIVDQGRVLQLNVETTGPLPNTDFCVCSKCCRRRRRRRR